SDVVVVGGGVIGLGIAWRAAQAGLGVTVVDSAPGRGASWAAAGMLAPVTEVHYGEQPLLDLNLASAARWRAFAAELEAAASRSVGYRRCGTLTVARDADDNAALEDLYAFQIGLGLKVERLRGRECRQLEPGLAPGIRGGLLAVGDHQVDNRALVAALLVACERAGVRQVSRCAAAVRVGRDRVTGVVLAGGRPLDAGTVVLAAGCWTATLPGLPPGLVPPIRPVKGQLLHLRGPGEAPICQRNVRGLEVYVVSRGDGRVVVGATVEEQGFETTVTAGGVHDLLRAAVELLPEVTELELTETVAGLRPGSPDNAPLIGPSSLEGLVVAAGHYRNGILLVPVTADSITAVLAGGPVPDLIAPFSPDRFAPPVPGMPAAHAAETGPPRVDHPGGGATAGGVGGAAPGGGVGGVASAGGAGPAGGPDAGGGPA
ncbi:MAG TPA: glycine oxidase ThiO, partial [Actinomycetes bacterium]|nr:glycine oxidase ThiO [Actinomycetes bacterium]